MSWCPTPTPVASPEPVVLVPGLAASHNSRRVLKDQDGGAWGFTPTVDRIYDPLIERLEAEGYELNRNLFVAYYDWRQSNKQSAIEYLIPVIERAKEAANSEKVDIVAHSMGGLVARAYAQSENLYQGDIDQLIMLGAPNAGAADAYTVWESGDFPERWGFWEKQWMLRIERSLKKTKDQKDLKRPLSFRSFFPSLRELIPTDTFITRNGEDIEPSDPNTFLQDLNDTSNILTTRGINVSIIAGSNRGTLESVSLSDSRTKEDEELQRWRDGHADPDPPQPSGTGDDTVTLDSAQYMDGYPYIFDNASHNELPTKAQDRVVKLLTRVPQSQYVDSHLAQAMIGVDVMSPVMPTITGPNGEVLAEETNTFSDAHFDWDPDDPNGIKMLTIVDPPAGKYNVSLAGTANGEYTVITSYADDDEDKSNEYSNTTTANETTSYSFTVNKGSFVSPVTYTKQTNEQTVEKPASPNNCRGDEKDCCPGHDPKPTAKVTPKVKGLGTGIAKKSPKLPAQLKPLNDIFYQAYGRYPTFSEWKYWANRMLTDKPQHDELLGAMQWHRLRGINH